MYFIFCNVEYSVEHEQTSLIFFKRVILIWEFLLQSIKKCCSSSISLYSAICLFRHTKGSGKYLGLYKMSEYSGFILVNRNTFELKKIVRCHSMSENFRCRIAQVPLYISRKSSFSGIFLYRSDSSKLSPFIK